MRFFKTTLLVGALILLPLSQTVLASVNEIVITDADTVWTPGLATASSDVTDSTDAPPQDLSEAFVSHADTAWAVEFGEGLAPPPENQPPTCAIKLQKNGVEIEEVNLKKFFDIYVEGSTDDTGIEEVRFASDESQDGNPPAPDSPSWTRWYDWNSSSEDWEAPTKIKRWSFDTLGDKEIWVEVKDGEGETDKRGANILVYPGYAIIVAGQGGLIERQWFDHSADNAYRVLHNLGFDDEHIFYLNSQRQLMIDGKGVVDADATTDNFIDALNKVQGGIGDSATPFVLFLVGHGDKDTFVFELGKEWIISTDLRDMLQDIPFDPALIAIWSCGAESFINRDIPNDPLTISVEGEPRIIVTGSCEGCDLFMPDLAQSSDRFWGNLNEGLNVKEAFIKNATSDDKTLRALDDNGDQLGHTPGSLGLEGELAAATTIGVPGTDDLNLIDWKWAWIRSPGELRIYDAQNRVTGLVNGEVKQEIPGSMYDGQDGVVAIFSPSDTYRYEVVGTDEGTYGLDLASIEGAEVTTFAATDIPTSANTVHQYTIDWDILSQGEKGVTLQIDEDGDGVFEKTVTADSDLTYDEFILQTKTVVDFDPDTLNPKSEGKFVTAYIELPGGYDINQVDVSSVMLNGSVPALAKPTEIGDYDNNGIPDLMVKFDRGAVQDILEVGEDVEVVITGKILHNTNRLDFSGQDTIRVIGEKNGKKKP